jgi:hypothetical protein
MAAKRGSWEVEAEQNLCTPLSTITPSALPLVLLHGLQLHPQRHLLVEHKRALVLSPPITLLAQLQIKAEQQLSHDKPHLVVRETDANAITRTARKRLARALLVRRVFGGVPSLWDEFFGILPVVGVPVGRELADVNDCLMQVSIILDECSKGKTYFTGDELTIEHSALSWRDARESDLNRRVDAQGLFQTGIQILQLGARLQVDICR